MESKRIEKFGKEESEAYKTIAGYKWNETFVCGSCSCVDYFEGKFPYSRRCLKCKKDFSPTAGTAFHGVRFPLNIALYIVKVISLKEDRITSKQLTEYIVDKFKESIRHKTVWAFQIKVYQAMTMPKLEFESDITLIRVTNGRNTILAAKGYLDFKVRHIAIVVEGNGNDEIRQLTKRCKKEESQLLAYDVVLKKQGKQVHAALSSISTNSSDNNYTANDLALDVYKVLSGINPKHYQAYLNYYCFSKNGCKYQDLIEMLVNPTGV